MKNNWFLKFVIIALCIKFLFNNLFTSIIFAGILGAITDDHSIPFKTAILGTVIGVESAIEIFIFTSNPGLTTLLGIFRGAGLNISDHSSYSTVLFIAFAYIVIVEILFVALFAKAGQFLHELLKKRDIILFH